MRGIFIILFLIFSTIAFSQVQRCGPPNYRPKNGEGNMFVDTCARLSYLYSGSGVWYCQNNIIEESAPSIISGMVSNAKVSWYKISTGDWYDVVNGAWRNRKAFSIDSLLAANNRWTGKNTFADSLNAEKGMKSGGLIDTKGMKSAGSSTKAATEANGVQKDAVIELAASATLDGTYNTIVCNAISADIVLTLPSVNSENNGWRYIVSKKNASAFNVRITASGFNHVIISPSLPKIIKNKGGVWSVE